MMKYSVFILAAVLAQSGTAAADLSDDQLTGRDAIERCSGDSEMQKGYCQGYIQAVFDSFRPEDPICPPKRISRQTIIDAVITEITDSSTGSSDNGYDAVKAALLASYPCR